METPLSFDIAFLGLKDASSAGRARMIMAMERLTGRSTADCQEYLSRVGKTIFDSLPIDQTKLILKALDEAGVLCEIRPKEEAARSVGDSAGGGMISCPSCGNVEKVGANECSRCGVVFSKREREQVRRMQLDQMLDEAQQRAEQVRREWDDRAKQIVDRRPLPTNATKDFQSVLTQEEIPFLYLRSVEGPLLLTSRQVLALVDGTTLHLPYEIIKDVDVGGGLVVKKGHSRLVLHFHAPIPFKGKNVDSITWQLTAESANDKDTVMDWAFARSYLCGSCGARDLDFRVEKGVIRARCMHCATDHVIDLKKLSIVAQIAG